MKKVIEDGDMDISKKSEINQWVPSKLFPRTQKLIRDKFNKILQEQVNPWRLFHSGKPIQITTCRGKIISYSGVKFSGSPVEVFWGPFIDECIEDAVIESLDEVRVLCRGKEEEKKKLYLAEAGNLLLGAMQNIYSEMARIDKRLRGGSSVAPRSTKDKTDAMKRFIKGQVIASQEISDSGVAQNSAVSGEQQPIQAIQRRTKLRGELTQKEAAALCGVCRRSIQNWEKGINKPSDYPGREDTTAFTIWAAKFQTLKKFTAEAKKKARGTSVNPRKLDRTFESADPDYPDELYDREHRDELDD